MGEGNGERISLKDYIDTRLEGVHRRIEDARHLNEREQDAAKDSLGYRLMAMDHDRDLVRAELEKLKSTVTKIVGGLSLAALLVGILVTLIVHFH